MFTYKTHLSEECWQAIDPVATAGLWQSQAQDLNLCDVPQSACLHEGWLPVDLGSLAKMWTVESSPCHVILVVEVMEIKEAEKAISWDLLSRLQSRNPHSTTGSPTPAF